MNRGGPSRKFSGPHRGGNLFKSDCLGPNLLPHCYHRANLGHLQPPRVYRPLRFLWGLRWLEAGRETIPKPAGRPFNTGSPTGFRRIGSSWPPPARLIRAPPKLILRRTTCLPHASRDLTRITELVARAWWYMLSGSCLVVGGR